MHGHLHAGERRFELVAHGGNHVALELVNQSELGDVLQHLFNAVAHRDLRHVRGEGHSREESTDNVKDLVGSQLIAYPFELVEQCLKNPTFARLTT